MGRRSGEIGRGEKWTGNFKSRKRETEYKLTEFLI
jgi:hypothetical protein